MQGFFKVARKHLRLFLIWFRLGPYVSILFQRALQRMLMLPSEVHDLGDLRLRDFVGINAADAHAAAMDMQHDARRLLAVLVEKPLEDINDELTRLDAVVRQAQLV